MKNFRAMRCYIVETTICPKCGLEGPWRVFRFGTPMAADVLYDCGNDGHVISVEPRDDDWDECPQCHTTPLSGRLDSSWYDDDDRDAQGGRGSVFVWDEHVLRTAN